DLNFVNAAVARSEHKRNPFHPFSVFDTVTMAGLAYGQTVLARAVQAAGMEWNSDEAHSAVYDTERTAQLFCTIANGWGRHATPPANPQPPDLLEQPLQLRIALPLICTYRARAFFSDRFARIARIRPRHTTRTAAVRAAGAPPRTGTRPPPPRRSGCRRRPRS